MALNHATSSKKYLERSVQDLFSLANQTVVITGGARGLGLAFTFAIAEAGGNVATLDFSDNLHPDYDLLAKRFPSQQFRSYKVDVTDYAAVQAILDEVVRDFGRIDGLIPAAGICIDEPFLERSPESVARSFNVNVLGTFYVTQLVAKQMKRQNAESNGGRFGGSIILVASVVAYVFSAGQGLSDYSATKGAIISLCKTLGVELAPYGIRVNSISPGYIKTDMTVALIEKSPDLANIMNTYAPMKRMGDLVDLKGVVVFLLSDASAYQTSEDIRIAGGIHAGRANQVAVENGSVTEKA